MKPTLNEQFIRMQKIAGIVNENLKQDIINFWGTQQDDAGQSDDEYEAEWENEFFIDNYPQYKGKEQEINNIVKTLQINENDIFNGQYSIGNEAYDKMDGLVNENDYDNFIQSATNIMNILTSNGFKPKEVFYYLYTRLTAEV
jgi:hypothetical protein